MSKTKPEMPVEHGDEHMSDQSDPANKVLYAYDSAGGTDISGGMTDIPFATQPIVDDIYSVGGSDIQFTVTKTGRYKITAEVTCEQTAGDSRSEWRMQLYHVDDAAAITGSTSAIYSRNTSQGAGTGTVTVIVELEANDTIKVQAGLDSGGGTIKTLANASRLIIERV